MADKIKSASFEGKSTLNLPEGAKITRKDYNLSVREIENGFIVRKSYDIRYVVDEDERYEYYSKEYYSKTNPLKIDLKEEKSLADKF